MTESGRFDKTRAIASIAIRGVNKFDDLNNPKTIEGGAARAVLGDVDYSYSSALYKVVFESHKYEPQTLTQRMMSMAIMGSGLGEKMVDKGVQMVARGQLTGKDAVNTIRALESMVDSLPLAINAWEKEGSVEQNILPDLRKVAEGIKKGDRLLRAKIILDASFGVLDKNGIDFRGQKRFVDAVVEQTVPELKHLKPTDANKKLLQDIQDYGLSDYVNLYNMVSPEGSAVGYGKSYQRQVVDSYRGKPKQDEVSSESYGSRLRKWEQEVGVYQEDRRNVVAVLSKYSNRYTDKFPNRGYDVSWSRENLPMIKADIENILGSESFKRIVEYSKHPKGEHYERSDLRGKGNFEEVANAIQAFLDFAEENDTAMGDTALEYAMLGFRDNFMGIYNIEEAKR